MLRITIELLPGGRETSKRTLGVAEIAQVRSGPVADYAVRVTDDLGSAWTARLPRYPRWAAPVWDLALRGIAKAMTGREALPRRPRRLQVPVHRASGLQYVRLPEIPEPARSAFEKSIAYSTCPLVEYDPEPRGCAYAHDWSDFIAGRR